MKKFLAMLLCAVMLFSLAACAGKIETPAPETLAPETPASEAPTAETSARPYEGVNLVLTVPIYDGEAEDLPVWEEILKGFTEKTGATVTMNQFAYSDLITTEMANLIAGEAADILFLSGGSEYDFWANGYLENLDSYFDQATTDYWKYWDYRAFPDGSHYVVAWDGGPCPRPIAVNLSIAEELGIELPADDKGFTWEYLTENAKKAIDAGYKGYVSPFSGNENAIITNYFNYVCQAGGSLANEEGKWDFTTDAALKAMTFIDKMFNTDHIVDSVTYDMDATYASFADGETLFAAGNVSWYVKNIETFPFEIELYQMMDVKGAAFSTCDSFALNAASENKEAAAALIAYLVSPECYPVALEKFLKTEFSNVSTVTWQGYPDFAAKLIDLSNSYWPPVAKGSAQIKEALQTHQQLVAMGQEQPEEALAAVQAVADEVQD